MREPRPLRRLAVAVLLASATSLPACSISGEPSESPSTFSPRPIVVVTTPPSTTGLYVSVAVDNHFHDIHPSDPPSIGEDRPFEVKNEGHNLHNFTVVGTDISVDLEPGQSLLWPRIGDKLKPGFYSVYCRYHIYLGMRGNFWVTT